MKIAMILAAVLFGVLLIPRPRVSMREEDFN